MFKKTMILLSLSTLFGSVALADAPKTGEEAMSGTTMRGVQCARMAAASRANAQSDSSETTDVAPMGLGRTQSANGR